MFIEPLTARSVALLEEAVVVTHLQLALDLRHRLKRDTDHDEDGRAAERWISWLFVALKMIVGTTAISPQEQRARQRDPVEHVLDVAHGRVARDARRG